MNRTTTLPRWPRLNHPNRYWNTRSAFARTIFTNNRDQARRVSFAAGIPISPPALRPRPRSLRTCGTSCSRGRSGHRRCCSP